MFYKRVVMKTFVRMKYTIDSAYLSYDYPAVFPDNVVVERNLTISISPLNSLPGKWEIKNKLNIEHSHMTMFPDCTVGGDITLRDSPITSLPDNLTVNGDLCLCNLPLHTLPKGLTVKGYLCISNSPVSTIPADCSIGKGLSLVKTQISVWPSHITRIRGRLIVSGCPLTIIPVTRVEGCMTLRDMPSLNSLPSMTVKGSVYLERTGLQRISNLMVGNNLSISGGQKIILNESVEVKGSISGNYEIQANSVRFIFDD